MFPQKIFFLPAVNIKKERDEEMEKSDRWCRARFGSSVPRAYRV